MSFSFKNFKDSYFVQSRLNITIFNLYQVCNIILPNILNLNSMFFLHLTIKSKNVDVTVIKILNVYSCLFSDWQIMQRFCNFKLLINPSKEKVCAKRQVVHIETLLFARIFILHSITHIINTRGIIVTDKHSNIQLLSLVNIQHAL